MKEAALPLNKPVTFTVEEAVKLATKTELPSEKHTHTSRTPFPSRVQGEAGLGGLVASLLLVREAVKWVKSSYATSYAGERR
ncbi:hypothetical protein HPB47_025330 [Ixodes persulcatus]|uniref:Uncharacterized protein n=1 Tax=Ixodes persulcatus TaxID=34615 RepID=A0AC60Q1W4_IXOPE|nr:hypothetical protein HPB47_025330 [Ixodes persulcatus]